LRAAIALNTSDRLIDDAVLHAAWKTAEKVAKDKGVSTSIPEVCGVLKGMADRGPQCQTAGRVVQALGQHMRAYLNKKEKIEKANARKPVEADSDEQQELLDFLWARLPGMDIKAVDAIGSVARPVKPDISQAELFDAMRACLQNKQHSPMLFVETVPAYLRQQERNR